MTERNPTLVRDLSRKMAEALAMQAAAAIQLVDHPDDREALSLSLIQTALAFAAGERIEVAGGRSGYDEA